MSARDDYAELDSLGRFDSILDEIDRLRAQKIEPLSDDEMLAQDLLMYGTMTAIRRPDGTLQRVDPRTIRFDVSSARRGGCPR